MIAKSATGVEISSGVDFMNYSHIPAQTVLTPGDGKLPLHRSRCWRIESAM